MILRRIGVYHIIKCNNIKTSYAIIYKMYSVNANVNVRVNFIEAGRGRRQCPDGKERAGMA